MGMYLRVVYMQGVPWWVYMGVYAGCTMVGVYGRGAYAGYTMVGILASLGTPHPLPLWVYHRTPTTPSGMLSVLHVCAWPAGDALGSRWEICPGESLLKP